MRSSADALASALDAAAQDPEVRSVVIAGVLATDDHREGLAAARERREPEFTGR